MLSLELLKVRRWASDVCRWSGSPSLRVASAVSSLNVAGVAFDMEPSTAAICHIALPSFADDLL
eukprot:4261903-Pyramimonas_sp.AAC.1